MCACCVICVCVLCDLCVRVRLSSRSDDLLSLCDAHSHGRMQIKNGAETFVPNRFGESPLRIACELHPKVLVCVAVCLYVSVYLCFCALLDVCATL